MTIKASGIFAAGHNYNEVEIIDMDPVLYRRLAFDYHWQPGDAPVALRRASEALFGPAFAVDGSLLEAARG